MRLQILCPNALVTHDHSHHHDHHHRSSKNRRRLTLTMFLAAGYMIAEIIGGLVANSLALLADAGHMFSDVAALGLSLFAIWTAQRPATSKQTYGFYRTEILAALINGAALVGVSIYIFFEAYERFLAPPEVHGWLMMVIASGGLVVNLLSLWILGGGREENLNIRGAWLHVLTDALGSIGAIAAGLLVWAFALHWADPAISVAIGVLVIYSSWRLLAESVSVLMEASRGMDVDAVRLSMSETPESLRPRSARLVDHNRPDALPPTVTADGQAYAALLADPALCSTANLASITSPSRLSLKILKNGSLLSGRRGVLGPSLGLGHIGIGVYPSRCWCLAVDAAARGQEG